MLFVLAFPSWALKENRQKAKLSRLYSNHFWNQNDFPAIADAAAGVHIRSTDRGRTDRASSGKRLKGRRTRDSNGNRMWRCLREFHVEGLRGFPKETCHRGDIPGFDPGRSSGLWLVGSPRLLGGSFSLWRSPSLQTGILHRGGLHGSDVRSSPGLLHGSLSLWMSPGFLGGCMSPERRSVCRGVCQIARRIVQPNCPPSCLLIPSATPATQTNPLVRRIVCRIVRRIVCRIVRRIVVIV